MDGGGGVGRLRSGLVVLALVFWNDSAVTSLLTCHLSPFISVTASPPCHTRAAGLVLSIA